MLRRSHQLWNRISFFVRGAFHQGKSNKQSWWINNDSTRTTKNLTNRGVDGFLGLSDDLVSWVDVDLSPDLHYEETERCMAARATKASHNRQSSPASKGETSCTYQLGRNGEAIRMPYSSRFTTAEWRTLSTFDFSDAWYNLRKGAQASFFNPASVLAQTPFQESDVEQLIGSIGKEAAENNGVVNPLRHIRRNVIRLIGRLCFGPDFRDEKFVEAMDVMIEDTVGQTGLKGLADLFPVLRHIPGFNPTYREIYKVKQRIEELISPCLDKYSSSSSSKENYNHYLQFLLSQGFPQEEVVIFNIFEMFLLAVDSTSLTIAWALGFLIHDQQIQGKLFEEVNGDRQYHEGILGMEQVSKMKYLQGVVKESARMRPIAPLGIPHKALNDTSLMGERIEAGTTVMVNLYAVLHDPAVWKEPDRFDPERFLETAPGRPQGKLVDDEEKDHAAMTGAMERSFLPFGAGRRNCAGMELAKPHVALTLGNLVKAFQWSTANDQGEFPDLTEDLIFVLGMKTPLQAKIVPRHP